MPLICDRTVQMPSILHPTRTLPCRENATYYVSIPGVTQSHVCGRHLVDQIDDALQLAREMGEHALALVERPGA